MGNRLIRIAEPTAARRRLYFHLVQADGITPATGEAGGQPQVSLDGGAFANTGITPLVAIGSGRYYAEIDAPAAEAHYETRYKSAGTAECPGDSAESAWALPGDEGTFSTVAAGATSPTGFTGGANLAAVASAYLNAACVFRTGPNKGIARRVTGYTVGRVVTCDAFPFTVTTGEVFEFIGVIV